MSHCDQHEFVRVADFETAMGEMGMRLEALEQTGFRIRTADFGPLESRSKDLGELHSFEAPNNECSSSLIASLQKEINANREEIRTCQVEWPLDIRKVEDDHSRSWQKLENLLYKHETWTLRKFEDLEAAINRFATDSTSTQQAGDMSMSQLEDLPALTVPEFTASDLPGFKALQALTSQIEKSGSSSKHTSENQQGEGMPMSQLEDLPALTVPEFTASDLPGFRALQELTSQVEKSGSSSRHTSQN